MNIGGQERTEPERAATIADVLAEVRLLSDRVAELEDSVAECVEGQDGLKRAVKALGRRVAGKKQLKKLKKVLDHLEVIEVGPDEELVAPRPMRSKK